MVMGWSWVGHGLVWVGHGLVMGRLGLAVMGRWGGEGEGGMGRAGRRGDGLVIDDAAARHPAGAVDGGNGGKGEGG